jgi:hypothetical protein
MFQKSITAFRPFALKNGSKSADQARYQEVIYYGESRFRQALLLISRANYAAQKWMQSNLRAELVCPIFSDSLYFPH